MAVAADVDRDDRRRIDTAYRAARSVTLRPQMRGARARRRSPESSFRPRHRCHSRAGWSCSSRTQSTRSRRCSSPRLPCRRLKSRRSRAAEATASRRALTSGCDHEDRRGRVPRCGCNPKLELTHVESCSGSRHRTRGGRPGRNPLPGCNRRVYTLLSSQLTSRHSHASPIPSPSLSAWSGLRVNTQLSAWLQALSPSKSWPRRHNAQTISDSVEVRIRLVRVGHSRAVVARVADTVTVAVGLVAALRVTRQLSTPLQTLSPS